MFLLEQCEGLLLGTQIGDRYIMSNNSDLLLEKMMKMLTDEDPILRSYRLQLAFNQVVKTDLIPILINCGARENVFSTTIRLLVNLSIPMECLLPKELTQTQTGKQTVYNLNCNLTLTREAFLDSKVSRVILKHMSLLLVDKKKNLDSTNIGLMSNCLLLIRNVLHLPDKVIVPAGKARSMSTCNNILWNFFKNRLDDVLLDMMGHVNIGSWCNTIVQIIALIYKDQHVFNLQKLLQTFLDSTLSESSGDESNTSPQRGRSEEDLSSRESSDLSQLIVNNSPCSPSSGNDLTHSPLSSDEGPYHMAIPTQHTNTNNTGRRGATNKQRYHHGHQKSTSLADGEPPPKRYRDCWGEFYPKKIENSAEDKVMECATSYSEADNMSMSIGKPKSGNQSSNSSESSTSGMPKTGKRGQGNTTCSSDVGYVSAQPCVQESTSSSSNDGEKRTRMIRTNPVKHKVKLQISSNEEKQEIRRRKMMLLVRQSRIRLKNMVNFAPTNEDISEILKEFTIDLLLTEYSGFVRNLLEVQRKCKADSMDKSHILWLITYFLKFATQLEIGLGHLDSVLSMDTLTYVTYEGVEELEIFELAKRDRETELEPYQRRMHLVVAALREFMQTLATYKQSTLLSQADKTHLFNLQLQSTYVKDLRQLLLLLIRSFNSGNNSVQYLTDLVVTNHYVLKNMEEAMQFGQYHAPKLDILDHVRQFANMELMTKFGHLLVNFQENTPQVNDSILTVMHHVAGDLESANSLFIPAVLQTFSKILEESLNVCQDWVDLIEYVIQKFLHTMQTSPHKCAATITENMDNVEIVDACGLTPAEVGSLFYHFNQVENHSDPVGAIIEIYRRAGNISLTRLKLIQSLLAHGIITHAQYMSFMYMKSVLVQCNGVGKGSVKAEVGSEHCTSDGHITDSEEAPEGNQRENREIKVLKDCLVNQGRGGLITWIQELLLDACRVKLYPTTLLPAGSCVPHEPVAFHSNLRKQSIPLVPFSSEQNLGLQTEAFILLLHKLGFLLPADVGKVYPRIPFFWSADHLYAVATKLGPLPVDTYRFTSDNMEKIVRKDKKAKSGNCSDTGNDDGFEDDREMVTIAAKDEERVPVEGEKAGVPSMTENMEVGAPFQFIPGNNQPTPPPFTTQSNSPHISRVEKEMEPSSSAPRGRDGAAMLEDEPMETMMTDTEYLGCLDLMDKPVKTADARRARF